MTPAEHGDAPPATAGAAGCLSRQASTPLLDAIQERGDSLQEAPFHVPGHKRGAGTPARFASLIKGGVEGGGGGGSTTVFSPLQYDLTEIAGLDYLSSPSGVIAEAQQLAAEVFGADSTWFLVNGCSAGIHAAVMAVAGPGGGAQRNHQQKAQPAALDASAGALIGSSRVQMYGAQSLPAPVPAAAAAASETAGGAAAPAPATAPAGSSAPGVLLVARNCHLSVFSALVLSGLEPVWLAPELDPRAGVAHCVTAGTVAAALAGATAAGRRVAGVMIVSPTYFGAVADVQGIARACAQYDVPLLVDEAHGGHFAFLPPPTASDFASAPPPPPPPSALSCGADLVMQSTHKVLGAMTQAAMLHLRGGRVSSARISRALQTLQSSSPSYLLMASLDAARHQAAAGGAFVEPCVAAQVIREAVSRCRLVQLLDAKTAQGAAGTGGTGTHAGSGSGSATGSAGSPSSSTSCGAPKCSSNAAVSIAHFDPLRLTLLVDRIAAVPDATAGTNGSNSTATTITTMRSCSASSGFAVAEWLEARHGVVPELATAKTVVLALGPGTTLVHARQAAAALLELDRLAAAAPEESPGSGAQAPPPLPDMVLSPRDAYFAATESVPAAEAVGRASAELLCPYPPGVPVLFPGERITPAALALLQATLAAGGTVTGATDSSLARFEVLVTE
ncbi:hypothetical protein HYH02_000407 [Chlamydomonas schloesseri]|uniref:Arginine decarboxylase n=1 Tax=Chlamydomonas schloesseri TaxID=2026947 RepID=A0A835WW84_9CHLO|nr:hypothetical protein HYH02_000407 [Chlamydomonas schloesseri]|eukprot:KAG2454562.1 hypothetical protein HYH02_000407 [Chlamydomonas schloesseri]